jgi:ketosteroid isomerase-like protein
MDGAKARARSVATELTSTWLGGDDDALARALGRACTPDVRWWTTLTGRDVRGPADASVALRQVLAPLPHPAAVTAVVVSDDGDRCVVELRSESGPDDPRPSLVTSVLTLREGRVSAARTYTDLPQRDGRPAAVVS